MHVASLWGLQAKHEDAIHLLTDTLREAEATHGVRYLFIECIVDIF